jgi:hypothetical protein
MTSGLWIHNRLIVLAAGAGLVVLVPSGLTRLFTARAEHPAQAADHEKHLDLFRSASYETAPPDWDPRMKPDVKYSPIGDQAIIQGDILIGKLSVVRQRRLYSWSEEARQIKLEEENLGLTEEQKEVIRSLQSIRFPSDVAEAARGRQRSKALRLIADVVRFEPAGKSFGEYPTAAVEQYKQAQRRGGAAMASVIQVGAKYRWPGGVIPYKIDGNLPNQSRIAMAIDQWHIKTDRIHLRPAVESDVDYVRFVMGNGCSSPIGRMGGEQYITLTTGCEVPQIIHEIGHTVGLWHEQCRNDRGNYLIIHDENIDPDQFHNFDIAGVEGQDVGTFDFGSIMLYPDWAFSDNGKPTVESRFPGVGKYGVGSPNITSLSRGDLQGVGSMYFQASNPPNPKHATPVADRGPQAAPAAPVRQVAIPNLKDQSPRCLPPIPAPSSP